MADRRKIIIDCDPGIDDAIALFWAWAEPEVLELAAVTCVAGNVPLAMTSRNALRLAALAGRGDTPIHAGCARPLMRPAVREAAVHGEDGVGGVALPDPEGALAPGHGVDVLIETIMGAPEGTVTLCPIGPLTNVALAMVKEPAIVGRLREIVVMGGAVFRPGNVTPAAEFNVHADPHAAQIVIASGAPIVLHGLDVTHQAVATPERVAALRALGNPVAEAAAAMITVYGRGDAHLHDPCVIAYLLAPELFETVEGHLAVDCNEGPNWGRTLCWQGAQREARPINAKVVTGIDAAGFFARLTAALARY